MSNSTKLILIKTIHTIIWVLFNIVLVYLIYAVVTDSINFKIWVGIGLFVLEGLLLLIFKMKCPLTIVARKYSDSTKDNFDIYLPNGLARYNKLIYTSIFLAVIAILIYRLST